jgi:NADH-quinone oxidoreductase subunit C
MSKQAINKINDKFPGAVEEIHGRCGDDTARIKREKWVEVMRFLKEYLGFDLFVDLTAVDFQGREEGLPRFEVVCHLRNMDTGERLRIKARVPGDNPSIISLTPLWKGADWFERECHEMYGIKFMGHPDPRPLLLYPEFEGYPLRKDYPIDLRQPLVGLLGTEERRFARPMDETPHGHDSFAGDGDKE